MRPSRVRDNRSGYTTNDSNFHELAYQLPVKAEKVNARAAKARQEWTWNAGDEVHVIDWKELGDKTLVECGRLVRLHIRPLDLQGRHPRHQHDAMIELSTNMAKKSFIAFDFNHPHRRLYLLLAPAVKRAIKEKFWDSNPAKAVPLRAVVPLLEGCQAKDPESYPNIKVKILGIFTNVVYHTNKKGDNPSYYIHQFGEVTGKAPGIGVDAEGGLWLIGGDYTCPVEGITN